MKFNLSLLFLFFIGSVFSQSEIYYFKDTNNNLTAKNIENSEFKLLENTILEKHSNATFWFKVPVSKTDLNYIIRVNSMMVSNVKAYQNLTEVKRLKNQRYASFKFSRESPLYLKVNSNFNSYYPLELNTEETIIFKEKSQILIIGFYYGVAFLVIFFSFFYFQFFKDTSFLYHGLLLTFITFSFVVFDGTLNFFNINEKTITFLMLSNYVLVSFCSLKFGNNFLLLDKYFPKVKKYFLILFVNIFLFAIVFLIFKKNELYIILNVLTFSLLFVYWFLGILLFHKNAHTKLFIFSYSISLFSALDYFVLKNFGISIFEMNPTSMKVGGLVQMIVMSFAVLFREKNLRKYNFLMKNEIISFSKEIEDLTNLSKEEPIKENIENLSIREREVFNLIVLGKTNKQIANDVNVSVNTVKFHVKNIYEKLNIKSRKEALIIDRSIKD